MRPYANTFKKSQVGDKQKRKERTSDEWDLRIDCEQDYSKEIVESLAKNESLLTYCLVSGIEQPDTVKPGSDQRHVHIAIITKYPMRRDQVLSLCRGFTRKTEEYATPRNKKFTYAGWYLHHTKIDWKLITEPPIKYEYGILPEDPEDQETKKAVQRMMKKFGCDESVHEGANRLRFHKWLTT